jgi:transcriptional regulator with XRE-family HTH domain
VINSMELKAEIKRSGLTQDQLANKIGIDPSTLNRKINNKNSTLSVDEAQKIVAVLNIPEEKLAVIFFNSKLA